MKYDNEGFYEEDDDLWNDELDLNTFDDQDNSDDDAAPEIGGYDDNQEESDDYYIQPDSAPSKPISERLFKPKDIEQEEENDFFTSDAAPKEPKTPKAPKLDPEDPDYWVADESELESILRKPKKKWKWWLAAILTILVLIAAAWIWYFRPYADNAVKYGYIKNMERRGSLIKTFEGSMIPYKELGDPHPLDFHELRFSVASDSLAAKMKRMMLDCVPVRVEYELYHTSLPWKGDERMIITKADTADVNKILPPDYRYYN